MHIELDRSISHLGRASVVKMGLESVVDLLDQLGCIRPLAAGARGLAPSADVVSRARARRSGPGPRTR